MALEWRWRRGNKARARGRNQSGDWRVWSGLESVYKENGEGIVEKREGRAEDRRLSSGPELDGSTAPGARALRRVGFPGNCCRH
jgi:hypothetical protein